MGIEAMLSQQIIGLSESIDDRVAALLVAGTGITLTYNDGAGTLTIANTGLGGSTGSTDNRILRADGAGGSTVQNSAVTIDDSGNVSGLGTVGCGAITAPSLTSPTGSGLTVSAPNARGITLSSASGFGGNLFCDSFNRWTFQQDSATRVPITVQAVSGSNANFLETKNFAGTTVFSIGSAGNISCGAITASALVTVGVYTVATLPAAASNTGAIAQVTDSSVTANGSTVAGSGANRVVVFSNGSTWNVVVA